MMARTFLVAAVALAWLGFSAEAAAQESEPRILFLQGGQVDVDAAKGYVVETVVPAVPAFALLNADVPQGIGAPFGGDSFFNLGSSGEGLPELGFAARPYWSFIPSTRDDTLTDYRGGAGAQALDGREWPDHLRGVWGRTLVSAASGVIGGDEPRAGLALGVSTALLEGADPRLDAQFDGCLTRMLAALPFPVVSEEGRQEIIAHLRARGLLRLSEQDAESEALVEKIWRGLIAQRWGAGAMSAVTAAYDDMTVTDPRWGRKSGDVRTAISELNNLPQHRAGASEEVDQQYQVCVDQASARYLRRHQLTIGAGAFGQSDEENSFEGLGYGGASAWIGYRRPIVLPNNQVQEHERTLLGELNLYARYEQREPREIESGIVSSSETSVAYASYAYTAADGDWRVTLAASWNSREYDNSALTSREFTRISGSIEYRLSEVSDALPDGAWLEIGYGDISEDVPDESSYSFVRLKFDTTRRSN